MPKFEIPWNRMILIPATRVKFRDIFNMKDFYVALREWLLEHEWLDKEEDNDHWESYYNERVDQHGSKELYIRWRVYKKAPGSEYLTYYLDLDFHCVALTATEIVREGRKLKVNKGEVEVYYRPFLEEVYKEHFAKNAFLRLFQTLFSQRIYRRTVEQRKKELYQETYELQNFVKQWFKLKRYLPYEETKSFFPSRAWPSHQKEQ